MGFFLSPGLDLLGHHDLALAVELEGHRAGSAQVAAGMGEGGAHVGGSAVAIVGQRLAEHGHTRRAVALVDDGLVVGGVLAGTEGALSMAVLILSLGME